LLDQFSVTCIIEVTRPHAAAIVSVETIDVINVKKIIINVNKRVY